MTEYKDLAALEANQQKIEEVGMKLFGSDEKVRQGKSSDYRGESGPDPRIVPSERP